MEKDLSSREITQKKIADTLDYLGENYNIIDKSVREGKATNMDIARSFTGDIKSDKFTENIGLLDLFGVGTYFAGEEANKAIMEAEPDRFKRALLMHNYMTKPILTTIARPDVGIPATELSLSLAEAIPFGYVVTKPLKNFLKSQLKKLKIQNPSQIND
jgi:hypothetical protein